MGKLQEIKAAQLTARKNRDTILATLLTTIIGEAEMVGKSAGNRESTDEEVLQVLKKFEKNMLINEQLYFERKMTAQLAQVGIELELLKEFLPQKLSDEQVKQDISFIMSENGLSYDQRNLGVLVPILKAHYGAQFDGQQVSTTFKSMM